ncbi:MAG: alpha,alpha-phosphotrehalase [Lachnospiraceae bacterium]|nr:alpha,alpha-phosphotrehalase [Lachnospiraceae bacterium]
MSDFRNSTVYQIYIKSFCDSNGDGIGDINGIRQKLDYLQELGIDYLWITPFFLSPMNDNGYDIADYLSINPMFGTMEDVDALIREAGEHNIRLMFDMVFNHTSTSHAWFQKALAGDPEYMDYYIFRDPVDGHAPTNWVSKFGGKAWEYVPSLGKYYLHLFDVSQADLNWENPAVREELKNVIRFWREKGVAGFRFDVVNLISKPDIFEDDHEGDGRRFYTDGPRIHQYLKELVGDTGIAGCMTVGEMSSTSLDNCLRYANPEEKELKMVFSFHHLKVDYRGGDKWSLMEPDFAELRRLFVKWQEGMQAGDAWNAVFWCNHDQPRAVSRFGDDDRYWKESAKMLALLTHLMRGTPYIYEGEEIGMTNAGYSSIGQYRDVESTNYYRILTEEKGLTDAEALEILAARSRDNGRTPMQWDGSEYAGFSNSEPWLGIPANHSYINVEVEKKDPDSIYSFYKKLIALRKEHEIIADGSIRFTDAGNDNILSYVRELDGTKLHVFCNLRGTDQALAAPYGIPGGRLLIGNYGSLTKFPGGPAPADSGAAAAPAPASSETDPAKIRILRPYEAAAVLQEA